jgi:hypothetical protein
MTVPNPLLSSWPGLVPAIHVFAYRNKKDVAPGKRRQVYAVCARLTALPGMTKRDVVPLVHAL